MIGGIDKDVRFVKADQVVNDAIDAAYHAKYRRHPARCVDAVVSVHARPTALELAPRATA
jgi:hypothetical protein